MSSALNVIILIALPVIVSLFVFLLFKAKFMQKLTDNTKHILVGVIFGLVLVGINLLQFNNFCIMISTSIAVIVCVGLIFGVKEAIISSAIGIIQLLISLLFVDETKDVWIMILSIGIACLFVVVLKTILFKGKRVNFYYCVALSLCLAIILFLISLLFYYDNLQAVNTTLWESFWLNILANCVTSVLIYLLFFLFIKDKTKDKKKGVSIIFQVVLVLSILGGFILTTVLIYYTETNLIKNNTNNNLQTYSIQTKYDVLETTDLSMITYCSTFFDKMNELIITNKLSSQAMIEYVQRNFQYNTFFSNICITNRDGLVEYSVFPNICVGKNIFDYDEYQEFKLMYEDNADNYVLENWQKDYLFYDVQDDNTYTYKFAGQALTGNYYAIYSISERAYNNLFTKEVDDVTYYRSVGITGAILFIDKNGVIVSNKEGYGKDSKFSELDTNIDINSIECGVMKSGKLFGNDVFYMCDYLEYENCVILTYIPEKEVFFTRNISTLFKVSFMIIIFFLMFILIYVLVQKVIVKKIENINNSLSQITHGNLETKIQVYSTKEFETLSNGINNTVDALKKFIEAEKVRLQSELELARIIQQSSLPANFVTIDRKVELYAKMIPTKEVGGDFFDFYYLDKNRLAFVIADVSGKGIPGAMFMMQSKAMLKDFAEQKLEVDEILIKTNNELCKNNSSQMFVTAWFGVLDTLNGNLTYCNAGHNPPFIYSDGKVEFLQSKRNFVLGGLEDFKYKTDTITLKPGSFLFLYTDGITDAQNQNKEFYGTENLKKVLLENNNYNMESLCKIVLDDVAQFSKDTIQYDDQTLLAIKYNGEIGQNKIVVPAKLGAVENINSFINYFLQSENISSDYKSKIKIIIDEIVSNIIKFSNGNSTKICFQVDAMKNGLKLTFADNGKKFNPLDAGKPDITKSADERAIGGLGLFIVQKLATKIQYEYKDNQNILTIYKEF